MLNFKVENIVRGTGLVYFNVSVDAELKEKSLNFQAITDEGVVIPCIAHNTTRFEVLADFILVVPLLSFKSITISCDSCDNSQLFTASQIKWMSRWNYKTQKQTAAAMRDFEKRSWANNVRLHFKLVMDEFNKREKLIKAFVNYPYYSERPKLRILDSRGQIVNDANIFIGDVGEIEQEGFKRKEYPFTLRVPEGQELCLFAESQDSTHGTAIYLDSSVLLCYRGFCPSPWNICNSWDAYQQRVYAREYLFKTEGETEFYNQEGPKFSIVVPLYKTPVRYFKEMVESVQKQYYRNWELVLVNASPEDSNLSNAIKDIIDDRVKVVNVTENKGISANTNIGIESATGDFIGFMDHDDTIDPRTLSLIAERINEKPETDVLYTDQDLIDLNGNYCSPTFKPSLNIDYLRSCNYISHFLVVRATLAKKNKFNSELDGSQDHDYVLRLTEQTENFEHIEEVLYHWRQTENSTALSTDVKNYAHLAGLKAIQGHFDRLGINAQVEETPYDTLYNPIFCVSGDPKVSIIIPNKNNAAVLRTCINSILEKTAYNNYEIVVVENGSDEQSVFDYYDKITSDSKNVKVIKWEEPFNFSKVCNFGAKHSDGEFLLFLNNDTEILDAKWLELMVGDCQREDVGVVGAKLIYPDDTIQHAGVYFSDHFDPSRINGPSHMYTDLDKDELGYSYRAFLKSNVIAVTGACLMTKADLFSQFAGFDEEYIIDYSDIDYCFKAIDAGYKILIDPSIVIKHYESLSLGARITTATARFMAEQDRLRAKWAKKFIEGDKFSSCIIELGL